MPYGTIKVDNITFDNGGTDKLITVSGLFFSTSGALTVTGTISGGNVTAPTATFTTLTGTTTAGTTATFTSGSFTSLTGVTTTGTTATFTSGSFTSLTGVTTTVTSGVFGLGSAAAPSIAFSGDTNNGIYSPGADQVAISTNGTGRLFVDANGCVGVGMTPDNQAYRLQIYNSSQDVAAISLGNNVSGSGALNGIVIVQNQADTQIINRENGYLSIATNNTERMRLTSAGLLGLGTSAPGVRLEARDSIAGGSDGTIATLHNFSDTGGDTRYAGLNFRIGSDNGTSAIRAFRTQSATDYRTDLSFWTNPTGATQTPVRAMTIDYLQRVGIGVTSPSDLLHLNGNIRVVWGANRVATVFDNSFRQGMAFDTTNRQLQIFSTTSDTGGSIGFFTRSTAGSSDTDYGTEKVRIDVSGRLLVGTSTNTNNIRLQQSLGVVATGSNSYPGAAFTAYSGTNTAAAPIIDLKRSRGTTDGSMTAVGIGDFLGYLAFNGADGTNFIEAASIIAVVDGTPGTNDMPGRLVFSTTADGAASPTERMRIANNGAVGVGDTTPASNTLRASFRGPSNIESALPVVSIVRTNNSGGGTGVAETGLDVRIPNTFNGAGEVKGINVFAAHNVGTSATYGIFAEAGGNPSYGNIYSGYFKVTQPDTNGGVVNYAVYAQANSTIGISSSGYSIGVTSETNNYVNNQNFRAVSLYTGASTQTVLSIIRNSSAIGSITTSTTATAYNTSSDYRLKENLVPLTGAIDRLQQIPVYRCNFIADPDRTVDCFIAHETQAVVPEAVHGTKDEVDNEGNPVYQGIDQSKLVPLLTAALQEAITEIASLKDRVAALEAS